MPATNVQPTPALNDSPAFFVVGCPRSGTTLLQRMLDNHPQVAVAYDSLFITKAVEIRSPWKDPPLTAEIVESVRSFPRFARIGISDAAVDRAAQSSASYSAFVSRVYQEMARARGKQIAGEKSPGYVKRLPLLGALFPSAKFVHVIRDGREVALSLLDWGEKGPARIYDLWQDEPVAVSALWWASYVRTGQYDANALGPTRYHEVRYEDLVAQPELTLRKLGRFLELPYAPEMARYHEGRRRGKPGRSAKKRWLPPTPGLRDWRTEMHDRDIALFEALSGDLLSELGYECPTRPADAEVRAVAEHCRSWWQTSSTDKRRRRSRAGQLTRAGACSPPEPSRSIASASAGIAEGLGPNPFVFVVGCPRSGTTLLQRMLDHHPELAVINELHFVPKIARGTRMLRLEGRQARAASLARRCEPVLAARVWEAKCGFRNARAC